MNILNVCIYQHLKIKCWYIHWLSRLENCHDTEKNSTVSSYPDEGYSHSHIKAVFDAKTTVNPSLNYDLLEGL